MPEETKKPAGDRGRGAERRTQPRYKFTAAAELVDQRSATRIEARVGDIGQRGCYVETNSPFPLGTETTIRITKGTDAFVAQARVVHSMAKGMGMLFTAVGQEHRKVLETWLAAFRQQEFLAQNQRRTQRVSVQVPVRVSGQNALGSRFEEETYTLVISANGALILLSAPVDKGQRLNLLNMRTEDAAECVVAYLGQRQGKQLAVGVGFTLSNPRFWRVAFPPLDWTQPEGDA
jgi:PilZ domain-containing protein